MTSAIVPAARLQAGITIYFVRHGETDWNRTSRYQGQADIPLNDTGRRQARRNGEALRALLPHIADADFVSSPLIRAIETMDIIRSALGLEPKLYAIDARLMEIHYGHWEGHLARDLGSIDPEGLREKRADAYGWRPRGGESYADLAKRTSEWAESITTDSVIVSHGGVSRVLRGGLFGLKADQIPHLAVPQDRILVLRGDGSRWL